MRGEKQRLDGTQRHRVHVAEIPTHLYMALRERFGPVKHNQEAWKRWLNDQTTATSAPGAALYDEQLRVAICIPSFDEWKADFAW